MNESILYKRATFATRLPVVQRYAPSHAWLGEAGAGRWRVGLTKFALRMLGELVDVQVERASGDAVRPGDVLGSIEGFKAVSDLYCVGTGRFVRGNPLLAGDLEALGRDPHGDGWIYEFEGEPDERCLDVHGYRALLDATIDRILQAQGKESPE